MDDAVKSDWELFVDSCRDNWEEADKICRQLDAAAWKESMEAEKKLKPGDTIHIRRTKDINVDKVIIKDFEKRIETLEKIVSVLLVDDELKEKVKGIFNSD